MRSKYLLGVGVLGLLSLAIFGISEKRAGRALHGKESRTSGVTAQIPAANSGRLLESYGKLPMGFEANQGQTDLPVKFVSRGSGYTLFLTSTEAVLALRKSENRSKGKAGFVRMPIPVLPGSPANSEFRKPKFAKTNPATLRIQLAGADPGAKVFGIDELPGKTNYLIGNDPKRWRTGIPTYAKVKYRGVYPGVDLVFYGNQHQLEYDLIVAPGANPATIKLGFKGAQKIRVDEAGDLWLTLGSGEICLKTPAAYQEASGNRQAIPARYIIKDKDQVGLQVAKYDLSSPLVIDPVLAYSTYLGGTGTDFGFAVAVDNLGNTYVTGATGSMNFPSTTGAFRTHRAPEGTDAFVTKLDPTGKALLYSTYLGGRGDDRAQGIAVDSSGNAYITGWTQAPNFPTTPGAFQTANAGGLDAFVTKLNATGSALLYSSYLGGSGTEYGLAIAVDSSSNAYVTGLTSSTNFPTQAAFQSAYGGGYDDCFVSKVSANGSSLIYSTYLGGSSSDQCGGITVDSSGNAYVTGQTLSANFPTTLGAFQTALKNCTPTGCGGDAFVTKLQADGASLVYSTYLGGDAFEGGFGIAVDSSGDAFVTGVTSSTNFPTTIGAFQTVLLSTPSASCTLVGNAFVTRLNSTGSGLVYSTYLGGSCYDQANAIAVDSSDNAYVTGQTNSTNFPTTAAFQTALGGGIDGFVTKLNGSGTALVYSTYLGGSGTDLGTGIAVDSSGHAYVTGWTGSTNFPTTTGAFQTVYGGGYYDAFVVKIQN